MKPQRICKNGRKEGINSTDSSAIEHKKELIVRHTLEKWLKNEIL